MQAIDPARSLFIPLQIASSQVYRMAGDSRDPHEAASLCEQQLRLATKTSPPHPCADDAELDYRKPHHRKILQPLLTMTLGVINRASVVLFLVSGASKARVVKAILDPKTEAERQLPASLVAREEDCLYLVPRLNCGSRASDNINSGRAYEGEMIVAGDIGGTKTHLALFDWSKDRVDPVRLESFHSADYTSLEDMLD